MIKKAVIPAAGFGTRILPITKSLPKEMYPILDRPAIDYIIEEAYNSGITDILIITTRNKEIIENYFDSNPELESFLKNKNKENLLKNIKKYENLNIYFTRQHESKGLGHAIMCAESFVNNEPFAVLYPDDVIYSFEKRPVCRQLIDIYNEFKLGVVGAKEVPESEIHKYGSLKIQKIREKIYKCTDMIEKPSINQAFSLYSVFGRCILTPEIFKILKNTEPGINGEIQLTDAMKVLAREQNMIALDFNGKRYDIGNKLEILIANIEFGLKNPEISGDFKKYLNNLIK